MAKILPRYILPLKFHKKGVGQMQLKYALPQQVVENGQSKDKEGAVYLEMGAPVQGGDGNKMDWRNKIIFKLNLGELSKIITKARLDIFPIKMVHKSGSNTITTLTIEKGKPVSRGDDAGLMTYRWSLGRNGEYCNIYISDAEMHSMFNIFEQIQPVLLGWGVIQPPATREADDQHSVYEEESCSDYSHSGHRVGHHQAPPLPPEPGHCL